MARASIGLPVYNGADTIEECLLSIQAQTFQDFEVVISDNGSTDGTSDICAAFCSHDTRFRHMRIEKTIPSAENFTRARDLTSAPYFMWRADDDLADPGHLAGLVDALDRSPASKLAVAPVHRILEIHERQENLFPLPEVQPGPRNARIAAVLLGCHPSWFYGLWRREAAIQDWDRVTSRYHYFWASDHLAMLPAIFDDAVELVPSARFIQRIRRKPAYHLPPERLWTARKLYKSIALELLSERSFSLLENLTLQYALHRHIEKRVGRYFRLLQKLVVLESSSMYRSYFRRE